MSKWYSSIGAALIAAAAFGLAGWQGAAAAEQEYVPTARAKTLHKAPLPGVEGKEVIIKHFAISPEFVGGKHMHPGAVYVYILEGELTVETGGETLTFKAGDLYPEGPEQSMVGRNLSASDDLELLVFQIGDEGKPMMVKVE